MRSRRASTQLCKVDGATPHLAGALRGLLVFSINADSGPCLQIVLLLTLPLHTPGGERFFHTSPPMMESLSLTATKLGLCCLSDRAIRKSKGKINLITHPSISLLQCSACQLGKVFKISKLNHCTAQKPLIALA